MSRRGFRIVALIVGLGATGACSSPIVDSVPLLEIPSDSVAAGKSEAFDWVSTFEPLAPEFAAGVPAREMGLERSIDLLRIVRGFLEPFEIDPATREFLETSDGGMLDFDLHGLYRSFPVAGRGSSREVSFVGRFEEGSYHFSLADTDAFETLSPGDFYCRMALTPIGRGALDLDAYELTGEIGVQVGSVGGREALAFLEETLRGLERINRDAPDKPAEGGLEDEDWALLASLRETYPESFAWIREYFRIQDLIERSGGEGGAPLALNSGFGPRVEAFEGQYPRIHAFLSSKDFSFRTSAVYRDAPYHLPIDLRRGGLRGNRTARGHDTPHDRTCHRCPRHAGPPPGRPGPVEPVGAIPCGPSRVRRDSRRPDPRRPPQPRRTG